MRAGIAKVNVNTELRQAYLEATAEALPAAIPGARVAALHAAQTDAVRTVVGAKARRLRGRGEGVIRRLDHLAVAVVDTEQARSSTFATGWG